MMLNINDILETINMVKEENLDIRTVTMGISLLDCSDSDDKLFCDRIYDKITRCAERLVAECGEIEKMYGIPIINKRVSVTPISIAGGALSRDGYVRAAKALDRAADAVGINFIGGFGALVQKGMTVGAQRLMDAIPEALSTTGKVCSSVNVASTKAGINMDAVRRMGEIIKETAALTADADSIGCAKLVVFANVPEDNPFMAGAFHGIGEPEMVINVGVSGPGVVARAIERAGNTSFDELAELIKRTAFKITRVGQLVALEASRRLDTPFGIVDLSLAPTPAIGDSVAYILEGMGLEVCGTHGTTAALALLNDAVKKGGTMASSHVGGLSGAFIPVSEDAGMIAAAASGALFGKGAGSGWLHNVFAANTDMVFAMICEELGLIIALCSIAAILVLAFFAVRSASRSRSAFYAIAACATVSMLLVQLSLNVFGSLDILPFTGVTFPFVSRGGTSLLSCWMLMAFIKGSDTRREGSFAVKPVTAESRVEEDEDEYEEDDYDEEDAE